MIILIGFIFSVSCRVADEILFIRYVFVTKRRPLFWTRCKFSICAWEIVLSGTVRYVNMERNNDFYSLSLLGWESSLNLCSLQRSWRAIYLRIVI